MKLGDKIDMGRKGNTGYYRNANAEDVAKWLAKQKEDTAKLNEGLKPYTYKRYVCETCGSSLCHPSTAYCFICNSDDWLRTEAYKKGKDFFREIAKRFRLNDKSSNEIFLTKKGEVSYDDKKNHYVTSGKLIRFVDTGDYAYYGD